MDTQLIKQAFDNTGYSFLYEKFKYQFYVSDLFAKVEQTAVIESFLEHYCFNEDQRLYYDDFSYYFRTFQYYMNKRNLQSLFNETK